MTDETPKADDEISTGNDDGSSDSGTYELDGDSLKNAIRDVLAEMDLGPSVSLPKDDAPTDEAEPVTIKAIEEAARRAVEEAMKPLRASASKKAPAKKATPKKPDPEPEASPAATHTNRLRMFLWGEEG